MGDWQPPPSRSERARAERRAQARAAQAEQQRALRAEQNSTRITVVGAPLRTDRGWTPSRKP
jgi:hypothetical protein